MSPDYWRAGGEYFRLSSCLRTALSQAYNTLLHHKSLRGRYFYNSYQHASVVDIPAVRQQVSSSPPRRVVCDYLEARGYSVRYSLDSEFDVNQRGSLYRGVQTFLVHTVHNLKTSTVSDWRNLELFHNCRFVV